jgi:hypothetical protein
LSADGATVGNYLHGALKLDRLGTGGKLEEPVAPLALKRSSPLPNLRIGNGGSKLLPSSSRKFLVQVMRE